MNSTTISPSNTTTTATADTDPTTAGAIIPSRAITYSFLSCSVLLALIILYALRELIYKSRKAKRAMAKTGQPFFGQRALTFVYIAFLVCMGVDAVIAFTFASFEYQALSYGPGLVLIGVSLFFHNALCATLFCVWVTFAMPYYEEHEKDCLLSSVWTMVCIQFCVLIGLGFFIVLSNIPRELSTFHGFVIWHGLCLISMSIFGLHDRCSRSYARQFNYDYYTVGGVITKWLMMFIVSLFGQIFVSVRWGPVWWDLYIESNHTYRILYFIVDVAVAIAYVLFGSTVYDRAIDEFLDEDAHQQKSLLDGDGGGPSVLRIASSSADFDYSDHHDHHYHPHDEFSLQDGHLAAPAQDSQRHLQFPDNMSDAASVQSDESEQPRYDDYDVRRKQPDRHAPPAQNRNAQMAAIDARRPVPNIAGRFDYDHDSSSEEDGPGHSGGSGGRSGGRSGGGYRGASRGGASMRGPAREGFNDRRVTGSSSGMVKPPPRVGSL